MNISAPFIRRSVGTALLTAAIALAGAVAFCNYRSRRCAGGFSTIKRRRVAAGASPEIMASSVAAPLERQLGHIAGVNEMTSSSTLGSSSITLQFDLNVTSTARRANVQAASTPRARICRESPKIRLSQSQSRDAPIMIVALTSDIYDRGKLYDAASTIIQQKLLQIEGVGQVNIAAARCRRCAWMSTRLC